jgi:hypothetical protein
MAQYKLNFSIKMIFNLKILKSYFKSEYVAIMWPKMKYSVLALAILALAGCGGEDHQYKDFTNLAPGVTEETFAGDSKVCEGEKNKHSHKIRGREAGYTGIHAGYLGCLHAKGWVRKSPELY